MTDNSVPRTTPDDRGWQRAREDVLNGLAVIAVGFSVADGALMARMPPDAFVAAAASLGLDIVTAAPEAVEAWLLADRAKRGGRR